MTVTDQRKHHHFCKLLRQMQRSALLAAPSANSLHTLLEPRGRSLADQGAPTQSITSSCQYFNLERDACSVDS